MPRAWRGNLGVFGRPVSRILSALVVSDDRRRPSIWFPHCCGILASYQTCSCTRPRRSSLALRTGGPACAGKACTAGRVCRVTASPRDETRGQETSRYFSPFPACPAFAGRRVVLSLWHFPWASDQDSKCELLQRFEARWFFPVAVSDFLLHRALRRGGCSDFPLIPRDKRPSGLPKDWRNIL